MRYKKVWRTIGIMGIIGTILLVTGLLMGGIAGASLVALGAIVIVVTLIGQFIGGWMIGIVLGGLLGYFLVGREAGFIGIMLGGIIGWCLGKFLIKWLEDQRNEIDNSLKSARSVLIKNRRNILRKVKKVDAIVRSNGKNTIETKSHKKELRFLSNTIANIKCDLNRLSSLEKAVSSYVDIGVDLDRLERKLGNKGVSATSSSNGNSSRTEENNGLGFYSVKQGSSFDLKGYGKKKNEANIKTPKDSGQESNRSKRYSVKSDFLTDAEGDTEAYFPVKISGSLSDAADDRNSSAPIASYARFLRLPKGKPAPYDLKRSLPNYLIKREIRTGTFANLYYGKKLDDKAVAIKVPTTKRGTIWPPSVLWEFVFEVDRWKKLKHKNIVKMHERELQPQPHIVMEKMEGGDLASLMKNHRLSVKESTHIMLQILEGTSHAHKKTGVHCDLKPTNILFTREGRPKISDWGWGKYLKEAIHVSRKGQNEILGYCAPEQINPAEFGKVDKRTDLFQLGIMYYEMLTGKNPFAAKKHTAMASKILYNEVEAPSYYNKKIPSALDNIILKALNKHKEERWFDGDDMYSRLVDVEKQYLK